MTSRSKPQVVGDQEAQRNGDDRALLDRARSGDASAFDALYLAHYELLRRYAYRQLRSPEMAEDIVHDVFLALWNRPGPPMVGGSVAAYLLGAVYKRAIDVGRRRGVANRTAALGVPLAMASAPAAPDAAFEQQAIRTAVGRAVAELPDRQQLVILLRWRERLPYHEIAAIMGITESSVRKLVDRAYVKLSSVLRPWRSGIRHLPTSSV